MAVLEFDKIGERFFETGVEKGVLFVGAPKKGIKGVAFNGLTSASEEPEGGDENATYADNIKYLSLRGVETLSGSFGALYYPPEFNECMGLQVFDGMAIGQQTKTPFSFCYMTKLGNDSKGTKYGRKLHIVYNATVDPVSKEYETEEEDIEPMELEWDYTTTSMAISDAAMKKLGEGVDLSSTSLFVIEETESNKAFFKAVVDALYGTESSEPGLLLPDDIIDLYATNHPAA